MQRKFLIYIILVFSAVIFHYLDAVAKEETDIILIPERPPTVEYFRKTTVDRPIFRRLNFIADPEINSLPVVSVAEFKDFYDEAYPVYIGIGFGNFGSFDGSFIYTSTADWHLGFNSAYTDGEIPRLYKKENILEWSGESFVNNNIKFSGNVLADEKLIWNQKKNHYKTSISYAHYLRENINIKADAEANSTEIKSYGDNRFLGGDILFNWQPFADNNFSLFASRDSNTALLKYKDFSDIRANYSVMPLNSFVLGGGVVFMKDKFFPQADIIWHIENVIRLSVNYDPGIEKKSFSELYLNDYYEMPNFDITYAEKKSSLKEKIGYYINENSFCEIELRQINYNDYIYRSLIAGTDFVALNNSGEKYASQFVLLFKNKGYVLSRNISVTFNSDSDMPFVPEFRLDASFGYKEEDWNFVLGYNYVSSMRYALNNDLKMPSNGDLSFMLGRTLAKDVEITFKAENILSETIETQPAFVRKQITFNGGVKFRF